MKELTSQIMYTPEVELWPSKNNASCLQEGTVCVLYGHAILSNVTDTAVHSSTAFCQSCVFACVCLCMHQAPLESTPVKG